MNRATGVGQLGQHLGSSTKAALPAITKYLTHDDGDVREAAAELRAGESTPVSIFGTESQEVLGRSKKCIRYSIWRECIQNLY